MKKILSAVLAVAMLCTCVLMFTACGGNNSSAASDASSKTEAKELHMATNAAFEPYEYKEGGEVVGIDADIANAICEKLGCKLVIDDMDFDAIITAVTSGKADFGMAGMTITDERKQSVDFTDPYTNAVQVRASQSAYRWVPQATSMLPTSRAPRLSASTRVPTRFSLLLRAR